MKRDSEIYTSGYIYITYYVNDAQKKNMIRILISVLSAFLNYTFVTCFILFRFVLRVSVNKYFY